LHAHPPQLARLHVAHRCRRHGKRHASGEQERRDQRKGAHYFDASLAAIKPHPAVTEASKRPRSGICPVERYDFAAVETAATMVRTPSAVVLKFISNSRSVSKPCPASQNARAARCRAALHFCGTLMRKLWLLKSLHDFLPDFRKSPRARRPVATLRVWVEKESCNRAHHQVIPPFAPRRSVAPRLLASRATLQSPRSPRRRGLRSPAPVARF